MTEVKSDARLCAEKEIKDRLKQSNQFQRGVAAVALLAGIGIAEGLATENNYPANASFAAIAAGMLAAPIERSRMIRSLKHTTGLYRDVHFMESGRLGKPDMSMELLFDNDIFIEKEKYDHRATPGSVNEYNRTVTTSFAPLCTSMSVALVGIVMVGHGTPESTHTLEGMSAALGMGAVAAYVLTELDSRNLEGVFNRQLDNIEGTNFTTGQ